MTKLTFIANGKEFATYAEAKKVSNNIKPKYSENWVEPEEAEKRNQAAAARRAKLKK